MPKLLFIGQLEQYPRLQTDVQIVPSAEGFLNSVNEATPQTPDMRVRAYYPLPWIYTHIFIAVVTFTRDSVLGPTLGECVMLRQLLAKALTVYVTLGNTTTPNSERGTA